MLNDSPRNLIRVFTKTLNASLKKAKPMHLTLRCCPYPFNGLRLHTMSTHTLLSSLSAPIVQAPMAGAQDHRLSLAVCEAGGLGSLPAAILTPQALHTELLALNAGTEAPYNVNFFCHTPPLPDPTREARWHQALAPYYRELGLNADSIPAAPGRMPFCHDSADVLEAFRPAVVSFHFGLPSPDLLARVKSWGSLVWSSATTVQEALWLQAQGVDAVIAQGLEAGGHRGMFLTDDLSTQIGTFALLPQIVQAVDVPVIAAGGIAAHQGVLAARQLGASGVQIGTAYLCSHEATTSAVHRAALQSPAAQHTALTRLFSGRPARGIVNRFMRELGPLSDQAPAFPLATAGIAPLRAAAEAQGLSDFTPLWSGQNASSVQSIGAKEITQAFVNAWHAGV
jgi:nitronate monooxygenase